MATEKRLIERIADRLKDAYPQADRNNLCPAICYDDFAEIVDDVLSEFEEAVDAVEVVHGHWISLTHCSNAGVYCSVCYKKVWKEDYAWCNRKNKLRSNYCPNCGAKMDGGLYEP